MNWNLTCRTWRPFAIGLLTVWLISSARIAAANTPIAGFQPLVGIGLTDEFKDDLSDTFFISETSSSPGGNWLGAGSQPFFDLALLDTGAGATLLSAAGNAGFDISGEGFAGTQVQQLGGATGFIFATVDDPLGIYATGVANRTSSGPLQLNPSSMVGQTSVSLLSLPPESDLPNILGLTFASQYSTTIHSDQPQVFSYQGRTVRTPNISFGELGSGGGTITRRAPITLNPSSSFLTPPLYVFNFENILNGDPLTENPTNPTNIQGGLFLTVDVANDGQELNERQFFFDTGADVTVVSQLNAVRLGFDPVTDEPEFTVPVLGSGGTIAAVPGFFVDELTVATIGGTFTVTNVPVIALDVTDPGNPGNIVPGIIGTNVFSGRNLVIDPQPALGGGGVGPSLYISDPVTTQRRWAATAPSANWSTSASWNAPGVPGALWAVNVTPAGSGPQTAVISGNSNIWQMDVSGSATQNMSVSIQGAKLTTFSSVTVHPRGNVHLQDGILDAQYVENLGGSISGRGTIHLGNGPLIGQLESRDGVIEPGIGVGTLTVDGHFANRGDSVIHIQVGGTVAGTQHDQLVVTGSAALEGILRVTLSNAGAGLFAPRVGDHFTILLAEDGLAGAFDTLALPTGIGWDIDYGVDEVRLAVLSLGHIADLNLDQAIDAADAAILFGSWGTLGPGDITADGTVDAADAAVLFGAWTGDPASLATVPEPVVSVRSIFFVVTIFGLALGRSYRL